MAIFLYMREQLVDRCKMRLMEITPDGELQIDMAIRGEFCIHAGTGAKEGELIHIEHFREIFGILQEG